MTVRINTNKYSKSKCVFRNYSYKLDLKKICRTRIYFSSWMLRFYLRWLSLKWTAIFNGTNMQDITLSSIFNFVQTRTVNNSGTNLRREKVIIHLLSLLFIEKWVCLDLFNKINMAKLRLKICFFFVFLSGQFLNMNYEIRDCNR